MILDTVEESLRLPRVTVILMTLVVSILFVPVAVTSAKGQSTPPSTVFELNNAKRYIFSKGDDFQRAKVGKTR